MQSTYSQAILEYEEGRYERAHDLFFYLSTQFPTQPEVWKGLAACQQVRSFYPEALLYWGMAAMLDPHDPTTHFHAGECLFAQGNHEEAQKALRLALSLPSTEEFLDQMVRLKEKVDAHKEVYA